MPNCLCAKPPTARRGEMRSSKGKLVYVFHMDCPQHGIEVVEERNLVAVKRDAWMPPAQVPQLLRGKFGIRLLERAPKDEKWRLEWIEWEREEELEDA